MKYFESISLQRHPPENFSRSSGKTLAANAGGRGFESHLGQNLLFFFTFHSIRVECEELFSKTNKNLYIYIYIPTEKPKNFSLYFQSSVFQKLFDRTIKLNLSRFLRALTPITVYIILKLNIFHL